MTEVTHRKRVVVVRKAGAAAGERPAAVPRRPAASRDPGARGVWVAGAIVLLVMVAAVFGFTWRARRRPPGGYRLPEAAVRARAPDAVEAPRRYDELGGKTMAEWMAENNQDNALLKERQQRLRAFRGR